MEKKINEATVPFLLNELLKECDLVDKGKYVEKKKEALLKVNSYIKNNDSLVINDSHYDGFLIVNINAKKLSKKILSLYEKINNIDRDSYIDLTLPIRVMTLSLTDSKTVYIEDMFSLFINTILEDIRIINNKFNLNFDKVETSLSFIKDNITSIIETLEQVIKNKQSKKLLNKISKKNLKEIDSLIEEKKQFVEIQNLLIDIIGDLARLELDKNNTIKNLSELLNYK